jgi:activated CDC42 kinase 1
MWAVAVWEMFTFGEEPWIGLNGTEILKKIDREGERLHNPDACPPHLFQLMIQVGFGFHLFLVYLQATYIVYL